MKNIQTRKNWSLNKTQFRIKIAKKFFLTEKIVFLPPKKKLNYNLQISKWRENLYIFETREENIFPATENFSNLMRPCGLYDFE